MTKLERIAALFAASAIGGTALTAVATASLFVAAPFVTDRTEAQVAGVAGKLAIVTALLWSNFSICAAIASREEKEMDDPKRQVVTPNSIGLARTCQNCHYFAGNTSLLFPCTVHPGELAAALDCRDFESKIAGATSLLITSSPEAATIRTQLRALDDETLGTINAESLDELDDRGLIEWDR